IQPQAPELVELGAGVTQAHRIAVEIDQRWAIGGLRMGLATGREGWSVEGDDRLSPMRLEADQLGPGTGPDLRERLALGLLPGEDQPRLERVQHGEKAQVDHGGEPGNPHDQGIGDFRFGSWDWRRLHRGSVLRRLVGLSMMLRGFSPRTQQTVTCRTLGGWAATATRWSSQTEDPFAVPSPIPDPKTKKTRRSGEDLRAPGRMGSEAGSSRRCLGIG